MDILFNSSKESIAASVVTIGCFDGVHVGHQALIQRAHRKAQQANLPLVVVSFEPMPREFFMNSTLSNTPVIRLQRLCEKHHYLKELPVDYLFVIKFNAALAALLPEAFIRQLLVERLGVKAVVVGADFRFGYQRRGDVQQLQQLGVPWGFEVEVVPAVKQQQQRVSSSAIRRYLEAGEVEPAARALGRPYSLMGRVVYGDQRGREWGFPTLNIPLFRSVSPLTGIYAVQVRFKERLLKGVASIGYRPVFRLKKPLLEVHLFDFDQEVYGHRVEVFFLKKLRDEQAFSNVNALIEQIRCDVVQAQQYFASE